MKNLLIKCVRDLYTDAYLKESFTEGCYWTYNAENATRFTVNELKDYLLNNASWLKANNIEIVEG